MKFCVRVKEKHRKEDGVFLNRLRLEMRKRREEEERGEAQDPKTEIKSFCTGTLKGQGTCFAL